MSILKFLLCFVFTWITIPWSFENRMREGCDFENGLCGWRQDPTYGFHWTRYQGKYLSVYNGPVVDHTRNDHTGYYISITSRDVQGVEQKARFLSPYFHSIDRKCLEFFYFMYGGNLSSELVIGTLEVFIRPQSKRNDFLTYSLPVFQRFSPHTRLWVKALVFMPREEEPYQIIFQASLSGVNDSGIAIDDILLNDCLQVQPIFYDEENETSIIETKAASYVMDPITSSAMLVMSALIVSTVMGGVIVIVVKDLRAIDSSEPEVTINESKIEVNIVGSRLEINTNKSKTDTSL